MPTPTKNPTLINLYTSLCDQQDALSAAIQNTTDPKLATTLANENMEVMHRIILTQNLLFQADSAALQQSVTAVTASGTILQTAIGTYQKVTDVINGVSSYLTLVDTAIDLAKKIGAA
jgi:hypothetical protein